MKKNEFLHECKEIAHHIFDGKTTLQIAQTLNYSKSTVALRMKYLFKKYGAKNRIEFIIIIFGELLKENKEIIKDKKRQIKKLNSELACLKSHLKNIIENQNSKRLSSIINEAKSLI